MTQGQGQQKEEKGAEPCNMVPLPGTEPVAMNEEVSHAHCYQVTNQIRLIARDHNGIHLVSLTSIVPHCRANTGVHNKQLTSFCCQIHLNPPPPRPNEWHAWNGSNNEQKSNLKLLKMSLSNLEINQKKKDNYADLHANRQTWARWSWLLGPNSLSQA